VQRIPSIRQLEQKPAHLPLPHHPALYAPAQVKSWKTIKSIRGKIEYLDKG